MDQVLEYAQEARLPFYVLHQTVIVIIGFYVVQWDLPALVKYVLISLATLLVTVLIYDIVIRRTQVTRFLFGMKAKRA